MRKAVTRRYFISLFLAFALLCSQFASAAHPLHALKKSENQNVELTCAYCLAATPLEAGPSAPVIHLPDFSPQLESFEFADVCEPAFVLSSRLTRGPPSLSTL